MRKLERVREEVSGPLSQAYLEQKARDGWTLAAVEWERESDEATGVRRHEVPYGLRVSDDCLHLEENAEEQAVMVAALDLLVQDCPMSRVAAELNRLGYRTRRGNDWTPAAIFDLLPRMIEAGPRIFTSPEWTTRIRRLVNVLV